MATPSEYPQYETLEAPRTFTLRDLALAVLAAAILAGLAAGAGVFAALQFATLEIETGQHPVVVQ